MQCGWHLHLTGRKGNGDGGGTGGNGAGDDGGAGGGADGVVGGGGVGSQGLQALQLARQSPSLTFFGAAGNTPAPSMYLCLQYPYSSGEASISNVEASTSASSSARHCVHELSRQCLGGSTSMQNCEHGGGGGGGKGVGDEGGQRVHTLHVSAQKPSTSVPCARAAHRRVLSSSAQFDPGGSMSSHPAVRHGGDGGGDGGAFNSMLSREHMRHLSAISHEASEVLGRAFLSASSHEMHLSMKRHGGFAGVAPLQSSPHSGPSNAQPATFRYMVE